MKLSGRRALITGATSGIGRAIALRFAREGAHVALTGRRRERLAEVGAEARATGVTAVEIVADHTLPADNARTVDAALDGLGGLDIVVNAAGILGNDSILDPKPDLWRKILDTNLEAVYDLSHRTAPHIVKNGPGGSILNLSSMAGIRAYASVLAYCVSKAAVLMMTQVLAAELAAKRTTSA